MKIRIRRRRATKRCDAFQPSPVGCGARRPSPASLLLDVLCSSTPSSSFLGSGRLALATRLARGSERRPSILLATRNRHKVRELRRLLSGVPVRLLTLASFPSVPSVRENGSTFRENAVRKAVAASRRVPLPVLAEDSGLEVQVLGGRPGIRSARYAGSARNDRANVAKLLRVLEAGPVRNRRARFVCVMAWAAEGRLIRTFRGSCSGRIADRPRGRAGFGYDPVFVPIGFRRTMAQMDSRQKNRISHRARAASQLRAWLRGALRGGPAG